MWKWKIMVGYIRALSLIGEYQHMRALAHRNQILMVDCNLISDSQIWIALHFTGQSPITVLLLPFRVHSNVRMLHFHSWINTTKGFKSIFLLFHKAYRRVNDMWPTLGGRSRCRQIPKLDSYNHFRRGLFSNRGIKMAKMSKNTENKMIRGLESKTCDFFSNS